MALNGNLFEILFLDAEVFLTFELYAFLKIALNHLRVNLSVKTFHTSESVESDSAQYVCKCFDFVLLNYIMQYALNQARPCMSICKLTDKARSHDVCE